MSVTNIDCATLKKWLKNDEAVLIDVRELAEYQESKIERAHLIPLGEISINSLPDFKILKAELLLGIIVLFKLILINQTIFYKK